MATCTSALFGSELATHFLLFGLSLLQRAQAQRTVPPSTPRITPTCICLYTILYVSKPHGHTLFRLCFCKRNVPPSYRASLATLTGHT